MLAKAVATEVDADCIFYRIPPAGINDRWVGVSEKKIEAIFNDARSNKNAVIFIDEVEYFCNARSPDENQVARSIKAELLQQMDGIDKSSEGILVLAATNLPWDLDSAFRRRFTKRFYIGLPDKAETRKEMFEKLLKLEKVGNELTPEDLMKLAENTDGFSGDDIRNVIEDAAMMYCRKVMGTTHFKQVTGPSPSDPHTIEVDLFTPCDSNEEGAIKMTASKMSVADRAKILLAPATREDFDQAVKNTRASVDPVDTDKYDDFTQKFGLKG